MKEIIQLKNLRKEYKDLRTVDLENLSVFEGEIYGFLGPNGAGKSTTMKMILSLVKPTSGSIKVDGKSINDNDSYLDCIGSMIEEPSYYPNLTAFENLLVFQKMVKFNKDNISSVLKMVGLDDEKNRKKLVKEYSLGMKQRLALAFALVKEPKILLLDEPTNGLDPAGLHEIRELIIRLAKKEGLTIFISSHILSEIEQVADRVGIINHGRLVYEGNIEDIKSNKWVDIQGEFSHGDIVKDILNQNSNITIRNVSSNQLILGDITNLEISELLRVLVNRGYPIYHISKERESLEEIFLELTEDSNV